MLYQKFRNSSLDTSPLGITCGADTSSNIFTPPGARIIAWAKEGIHFCHVSGFGNTVFVVDPSAPPGDCVHPVANNLTDFIGLLHSCKDALLIARAYQWSELRFSRLVAAIRPGMKAQSVLRALMNTYHPPLFNNPHRYISDLQREFDYTTLPLHPDYYEWCPIRPGTPKWEVGFGVGFGEYCDKQNAGQELQLKKTFTWQKETWCVPSVYMCPEGIVVDSYLEMPADVLLAFDEKWSNISQESLAVEEKMRRDLDDPLYVPAKSTLLVNGKLIPARKSFFLCWNPTSDNTWNARRTVEHYRLDREKGYLLRRECFMRKHTLPPVRTMELTLMAEPVSVPGQRFKAPKAGESMQFTHPSTGDTHELTVLSRTREALDPNFLSNHPCCYTKMHFTVEPPIGKDMFSVVDCDPGDPWDGDKQGVAAILASDKIAAGGHCAVSSLRYTPAEQITWRMVFRQKLREDLFLRLLPQEAK